MSSRTILTDAAFFASLVLVVSFLYASAETYYVLPTPSVPCPEKGVPCFTLSKYAAKPSDYFASNTSIILLPGNHTLDSELTISKIKFLIFETMRNFSTFLDFSGPNQAIVTCSQPARFKFEVVEQVLVNGITFVGCMNNNAIRVDQFSARDCRFDGQGRNGTGLILSEVDNTNIIRSFFFSNTGSDIHLYIRDYYFRGGGAMLIVNCRTVNIAVCLYTNNFVIDLSGGGGVVWSWNSTIAATNSTFTNNFVSGDYGHGGVVAAYSSTVTATNSIFNSNFVSGDIGRGGVVAAYSSTFTATNSTFSNNSVRGDFGLGGVVAAVSGTITATNSIFNNNFVSGDYGLGGVVFADSSAITATNSTFSNNSVSGVEGKGGVVFADHTSTILTTKSTFTNNFLNGGRVSGGVVAAETDSAVIATNSTFNNNSVSGDLGIGGVVAADSSAITANNSTFTNNSVSGVQGAGGVVFAVSCKITATNSTFTSNSVTGDYGRGGALWLSNSMTTMSQNKFQYNVAPTGTVYAVGSRVYFYGSLTISNNCGSLYASSSNITFAGNTDIMNNSIDNSTSSRISDSEEGGAVTGFQSNLFFNDKVNIQYNTGRDGGGISVSETKIYTYGSFTVAHNMALLSGGGIYAYHSELNLKEGSVKIFGNTANEAGGGVHAIGSSIAVRGGSVRLVGNHAKRGGGMSFMLNSKLYIIKASIEVRYGTHCNVALGNTMQNHCIHLEFADNIAEYGGALFVYDDTNSGTCQASSFNVQSTASSECFIQSLGLQIFYNSNLNLLNTYFTNNTATRAGTTLYGGLLDRCTVSHFAELFFNRKYTYSGLTPNTISTMSYLLNITNLQPQDFGSNATVSSDAVRVCFCRENHPDCSYQPPPLRVKKGQTFNISIVAVDQVNNTVANSKMHASLSQSGGLGERQSIQQTSIDGSCTELSYNILSLNGSVKLQLYAQGPCMDSGISTSNITVHIVPCPVGFTETNLRCACDPLLLDYVSNCSIDNESVQRKHNAWFSHVNDTKHQAYILHKQCPFDYCKPPARNVSVNLNVPNGSNDLCAFNRSGKLCGSCEDGLSLSLGSSRCRPCSNNWIAMIAVFAMAGIALVAFLVFCNLTVVSGTINGLTLYANVINANHAIFFPVEKTNVLTLFIAWINLDFGFESCFFNGMNGYWKVWLQLAFPFYILFLVGVVIFLANRHYRYVRFLFDLRNPVTTLATLFLLCYTKFVRTLIAGLSFGTLEYSDGFTERVWLFDANIPYLEGKHIPLFVASLLILVLGLVYTSLIFSWQWIKRCHLPRCLKKIIAKYGINAFMDAYHAPFNTQHRYWTGLLLLVRVVLYLISALNVLDNPSINLMSIIVVMGGCYSLLNNPRKIVYKNWILNVLESSYILNLIVLAAFTLYIRESNGNQTVLAYISTGIAFVTFLATVAFHAYTFILKRAFKWPAIKRTLEKIRNRKDVSLETDNEAQPLPDGNSEVKHDADYGVTEINGLPDIVDTESIDGDPTQLESDDDSETYVTLRMTDSETLTIPSFTKSHPTIQQNSAILSQQLSVNVANIQPATRNERFVEVELHNFASLKPPPQISPSSQAESEDGDDDVFMGDELTPLLPQD